MPILPIFALYGRHTIQGGKELRAQAGKDSFVRHLARNVDDTWAVIRVSFADRMKEELATNLGISIQRFATDKEHFRRLMQEWMRARQFVSGPYCFSVPKIQELTHYLECMRKTVAPIFVFTDIRRQEDADLVEATGAQFIEIHRDSPKLTMPVEVVMDPSEAPLRIPKPLAVLHNTTPEGFGRNVGHFWSNLYEQIGVERDHENIRRSIVSGLKFADRQSHQGERQTHFALA